jgi:hypothetical protein
MPGRPTKRCNSLISKGRKLNAILLYYTLCVCVCVCVCVLLIFTPIHRNRYLKIDTVYCRILQNVPICADLVTMWLQPKFQLLWSRVWLTGSQRRGNSEVYYSFVFARCFKSNRKKKLRIEQ